MGPFSDLPAFELQWLAQHINGISLLGSAFKVMLLSLLNEHMLQLGQPKVDCVHITCSSIASESKYSCVCTMSFMIQLLYTGVQML